MKWNGFKVDTPAGKPSYTVALFFQLLLTLLLTAPASAGIYEWVSNGPTGGDARAVAVDPIYPTTLYAGFNNRGGLYKSTNGGETWNAIGRGLMDSPVSVYGVFAIAIDPVTPTTLYAGTFSGGVFKSVNGGSDWQQASNGLTDLFINTVAINPANPSILYAGTEIGLCRSIDGGNSWQNASNGLKDPVHGNVSVFVNDIVIDPKTPGTLYLGTYSGVFKSTNGGDNWVSVNSGLPELGVATLDIDQKNTKVLYAGMGQGVFKSSDGGASWRPANTGLPSKGGFPINSTTIKVDPVNPGTLYTLINCGLFKSSNGGDTWSQLTTDDHVNTLTIDPVTPTTLYLQTYAEGIAKSIDSGHSWASKNSGITGSFTTAVVQDPGVPTTVYAADNGKGVFKSTNRGGNWIRSNSGLSNLSVMSLAIDPATPSTLYAGNDDGVSRSTNRGDSWSLVGKNVPGPVRSIAVALSVPSIIYAATDVGVFKSSNRGDSWDKVSINFPYVVMGKLAVDPRDSEIVYAGTQLGVFKSTNGGVNWKQMYVGMKDPSLYFFALSIAIDPVNTSILYAATERGVFKSTNGGDSWTSTSDGSWMSAIVIDPTDRNILYAGTGQNFWVSNNAGGSWYPIQTNRTNGFGFTCFAIASGDPTTMYAGTDGGGVNSMNLANATTTVAKPRGAVYVSAQQVSLFSNAPATIYYTTDGSDPASSPTKRIYSDSIRIASDLTVKSYGVDHQGIAGPGSAASYVIDTAAPTTTLTPGSGRYASSLSVSLACSDGTGSGCAKTYYCLGTNCTPISVYSGPIPVSATTDLRYYSADIAGNREAIATSRFTLGNQTGGLLTVSINGSGSVHGTSTFGQNYSCAAATCPAAQYAYGDEVLLIATDSADHHFGGWSGACTASSGSCLLTMTADRGVTATFSMVTPIRLYKQSGSQDYQKLSDAYAGVVDREGSTIACREVSLVGGLVLDRPVALRFKGGYDTSFAGNVAHVTALQGELIVRQGSIKVENLVLR
jgi:photosystem II stability/assembly factor-like uncharacterized protein